MGPIVMYCLPSYGRDGEREAGGRTNTGQRGRNVLGCEGRRAGDLEGEMMKIVKSFHLARPREVRGLHLTS